MNHVAPIALACLVALPLAGQAADARRQADVARRGADVMPFRLDATIHVFTRTAQGGTQRVVARDPHNAQQVRLVREHLREIGTQFRRGDFSGPTHVHGNHMPGLEQLKIARPGAIAIAYRNVRGGAELAYRTADPQLVAALHAWFDAQLSDHGKDAMAGHGNHDHDAMHRP